MQVRYRILRLNWQLWLGCLLGLVLLCALVLPYFRELNPPHVGQHWFFVQGEIRRVPLEPGAEGYLFGTDRIGRDLFARVILGARLTLGLVFAITAARFVLGVPLGLIAGWRPGGIATGVRALNMAFGSIPTLIVVAAAFLSLRVFVIDPDRWLVLYGAIVAIAGVPRVAEQVRLWTDQVVRKDFVEAAVASGARPWRILWRHVFPQIRGDLVATASIEAAWVLMLMGQLAIFGVHVGEQIEVLDPYARPFSVEFLPEWSQMVAMNRWNFRIWWWLGAVPAAAITLSACCFYFLGEGLRKRFEHRV